MTVTLDSVLLGSVLVIDTATLVLSAIVVLLALALLGSRSDALSHGAAARIALTLVAGAAVLQCLSGDMLLFLAAGAVLGYALLALGLTAPRCLTPNHAIAAAVLLVAGDLALLELAMLLGKSAAPLTFDNARGALTALRGDTLTEFCLILGFGSRLGLPALCLPARRAARGQLALLPGWLMLAVCAVAGALRLSCGGDIAARCAAPLTNVLWWVPLLALTAWLLPLWTPGVLRALQGFGGTIGELRDRSLQQASRLLAGARTAPAVALRAESLLTRWPVALGAGIVAGVAIAAMLMLSTDIVPV